jgi:uncharacterized protein YegL
LEQSSSNAEQSQLPAVLGKKGLQNWFDAFGIFVPMMGARSGLDPIRFHLVPGHNTATAIGILGRFQAAEYSHWMFAAKFAGRFVRTGSEPFTWRRFCSSRSSFAIRSTIVRWLQFGSRPQPKPATQKGMTMSNEPVPAPRRPGGGQETRRDLHFFWLVDSSGSMTGEKIASLNFAIANAIPRMREVVLASTNDQVLVHVIRFASDIEWMTDSPVPLSDFRWKDIKAGGETEMGAAISAVTDKLAELQKRQDGRYIPPALILVTDGHPTDGDDYTRALRKLMDTEFGRKATRLAVAIGDDADFGYLQAFIANPDIAPVQAHTADDIATLISLMSVVAIEKSVTGKSKRLETIPETAKVTASDPSWIIS